MLSRDSEDATWSRFVFELVIWPQEVTLVRWTQPSGPLCLWQCFCIEADFKHFQQVKPQRAGCVQVKEPTAWDKKGFVYLDLDLYFFVESSLHLDISNVESVLNQPTPQFCKWLSYIEELRGSPKALRNWGAHLELRSSPEVGGSVRNWPKHILDRVNALGSVSLLASSSSTAAVSSSLFSSIFRGRQL